MGYEEEMEAVSKLISNLETGVHKLCQNVCLLLSGIEDSGLSAELAQLRQALHTLQKNTNHLLGPVFSNFLQGNHQGDLDVVRAKYQNLQREWDNQQEHLGRLQGEIYRLRNQLQTQSSFCASLGSIMGNLVWKASRLQPVVELLLTTNKLSDFFGIASGTLVSFMETYQREMPDIKCDETQFILAMGGIVANIAAVPEGRQFLVTDNAGRELVAQILRLIPNIPPVSGDPLKRILLMVLYNVSINQGGLLLIQDNRGLLQILVHTIVGDRSPELRIMALRLLESMTSQIPTAAILKHMQNIIPMKKIDLLQDSTDAEVRHCALRIVANMVQATEYFGNIVAPSSPSVPFTDCALNRMANNTNP